jgi:hypothetical protein
LDGRRLAPCVGLSDERDAGGDVLGVMLRLEPEDVYSELEVEHATETLGSSEETLIGDDFTALPWESTCGGCSSSPALDSSGVGIGSWCTFSVASGLFDRVTGSTASGLGAAFRGFSRLREREAEREEVATEPCHDWQDSGSMMRGVEAVGEEAALLLDSGSPVLVLISLS